MCIAVQCEQCGTCVMWVWWCGSFSWTHGCSSLCLRVIVFCWGRLANCSKPACLSHPSSGPEGHRHIRWGELPFAWLGVAADPRSQKRISSTRGPAGEVVRRFAHTVLVKTYSDKVLVATKQEVFVMPKMLVKSQDL